MPLKLNNNLDEEQPCVAVGPGNAHFISIHQVSPDAATVRRDTCGYCRMPGTAAGAAVYRQCDV